MPNRAAKLVLTILGSIIAGLTVAQAAGPAKDCLAAPNGQPVQGSHWYYRIDHATNRHCWYVRAESQRPALASSQPVPPSGTALQPSVANARAEMPVAETIQPNDANGSPPSNAQSRTLAERWSDHPNASSAAEAAPEKTAVVGSQQLQPTSAMQMEPPSGAYSVWMLIGALVGALVLVGTATGLIAHFGRGMAIGSHSDRDADRTIWNPQPSSDFASSVGSHDETPMNWVRIAREAQEAHRRAEQVEQLLSRGARRGAV
jgi:hypothetical protein